MTSTGHPWESSRQAANDAYADLGAGRGDLALPFQDGELHVLLAGLVGLETTRHAVRQRRVLGDQDLVGAAASSRARSPSAQAVGVDVGDRKTGRRRPGLLLGKQPCVRSPPRGRPPRRRRASRPASCRSAPAASARPSASASIRRPAGPGRSPARPGRPAHDDLRRHPGPLQQRSGRLLELLAADLDLEPLPWWLTTSVACARSDSVRLAASAARVSSCKLPGRRAGPSGSCGIARPRSRPASRPSPCPRGRRRHRSPGPGTSRP